MSKLRALIVDDSEVYRKLLSDILSVHPKVEVAGMAANGNDALRKARDIKPDFVTLDIEMPDMNGIDVLKHLKIFAPDAKVIMVSSNSHADITMRALNEGAFDFILKPSSGNFEENKEKLRSQLNLIVNVMFVNAKLSHLTNGAGEAKNSVPPPPSPAEKHKRHTKFSAVGIGISTGGPKALAQVIPSLPENFNAPVLIVQHMPPLFTKALADSLSRKSKIPVLEAEDGLEVRPGVVHIAPGGRHMRVENVSGRIRIRLSDDPPENSCRPAVDYLFRSMADVYSGSALGVIMTGMGADGVKGLAFMRAKGSKVIAQDEASCTVFGMPMEAIKAGVVDTVLPLDMIAGEIVASIKS